MDGQIILGTKRVRTLEMDDFRITLARSQFQDSLIIKYTDMFVCEVAYILTKDLAG